MGCAAAAACAGAAAACARAWRGDATRTATTRQHETTTDFSTCFSSWLTPLGGADFSFPFTDAVLDIEVVASVLPPLFDALRQGLNDVDTGPADSALLDREIEPRRGGVEWIVGNA